jgi:error-prone DNA polymerase
VEERERGGPYLSLVDFLRRTPAALKRPAIENLIWVGGFDALGLSRRELLWQAGLWLGPESDPDRTGGRDDHPQTELPLDDPYAGLAFPGLDAPDRLVAEYRMLHFAASLHPLSLLREQMPADLVGSDRFASLPQHATVRVAGLVTARQRPATAKGYVFVLLEDEIGPINVIVKPRIYERDRAAVRMEPFVLVRGRLQKDGATMNVVAFEVEPLRMAPVIPDEKLQPGLPETLEYWGNRKKPATTAADVEDELVEARAILPDARETWSPQWKARASAFRYLTALRQSPPGIKSFG